VIFHLLLQAHPALRTLEGQAGPRGE
jgi:hypothetical protein